jgi:hypothetical protein
VAAALSAWISRDKPVSRLVFNASTLTLAAVAAAYAYAGLVAVVPHPASIIAGAAGGALAMWVANTLLVGTIVSLSTGTPFRTVVRENYAWLWTHFVAMGLVALALAMVWDTLGAIGVIAFIAPVVAVMLALREGAEQARDVVLHAEHERVALRSYDRLLSELDDRDRQSSPRPDLATSRMARVA